jgi:transglutaminase-like putative cysteine protease
MKRKITALFVTVLTLIFVFAFNTGAAENTSVKTKWELFFKEYNGFAEEVKESLENKEYHDALALLESETAENLISEMEKQGLDTVFIDEENYVLQFYFRTDGKNYALSARLHIGTEKNGIKSSLADNGSSYTDSGMELSESRQCEFVTFKNGEPYGEFEKQFLRGGMSDGVVLIKYDSVTTGTVGGKMAKTTSIYEDGTTESYTYEDMQGVDPNWNGHKSDEKQSFLKDPNAEKVFEMNTEKRAEWCNPGDYWPDTSSSEVKKLSDSGLPVFIMPSSAVTSEIKELSDSIVGDETDDYMKLFLINKWVADNIYYDYDKSLNGIKTFYTPKEVYQNRRTVCEGYANLTQALIWAQGIPCMKVHSYALAGLGSYTDEDISSPSSDHATVEAWTEGRWVIMDPTWDSPNSYRDGEYHSGTKKISNGSYNYDYFDALPEFFAEKHLITSRPCAIEENTPSDWAQEDVLGAIVKGLVPYAQQRKYKEAISRENIVDMIVVMLEKVKGKSIDEIAAENGVSVEENRFSDTNSRNVDACFSLGVVNGVGEGLFNPDGNLTRAEMIAMINRTANLFGIETNGCEYTFDDTADHWVNGEIGWSVHAEIINGVGDNKFAPDIQLTKEQAILILYRACGIFEKTL